MPDENRNNMPSGIMPTICQNERWTIKWQRQFVLL